MCAGSSPPSPRHSRSATGSASSRRTSRMSRAPTETRGRRARILRRAAWALAAAAVLTAGVWLGIEGHVLQRVYYYIERDAVHEMGATPAVRAMLWSTPREIPGHGPADGARAGAAAVPVPGERAHLSRSAMLVSLKTAAGDFDIYLRELTALGWSAPH